MSVLNTLPPEPDPPIRPINCRDARVALPPHPLFVFTVPRSVRMQPTDSDTSASQRSLCCVRFPTDSAVCLWAWGSCQGIPGGTRSWKVIEFEGEKTAEGRGEDSAAAEGNDCGGGRAKGCRDVLHGECGSSSFFSFFFHQATSACFCLLKKDLMV